MIHERLALIEVLKLSKIHPKPCLVRVTRQEVSGKFHLSVYRRPVEPARVIGNLF
jgi:hypothetical protein